MTQTQIGASEQITDEVTSWPGVEAGTGTARRVGVHRRPPGDRPPARRPRHALRLPQGRLARALRRRAGSTTTRSSPASPASPRARSQSEDDVLDVIALLRLNYDRAIATHGLPGEPHNRQFSHKLRVRTPIVLPKLLTKHCAVRHSCADARRQDQARWSRSGSATAASSLDALRRRGSASRADLARLTGLSRSTVSTLVADLQASGLVVEHADAAPRRRGARAAAGPPADAADARPLAPASSLGIDFGHEHVHVAIADLSRTILAERVRALDVDHSAARALDVAVELADEVVAAADVDGDRILGAGVGAVGADRRRRGHRARRQDPARAGRASGPSTSSPRASACASTSTTTRTSARSPRSRSAPASARATRSTSWSPAASAPGSSSAASCTAAAAAPPASSATCSSTRPARSAAAATAAAWR